MFSNNHLFLEIIIIIIIISKTGKYAQIYTTVNCKNYSTVLVFTTQWNTIPMSICMHGIKNAYFQHMHFFVCNCETEISEI